MYLSLLPMKTQQHLCAAIAALITSASATVTMDWVTIGNANNAADPATGSLYGAVGYAYQIGKYEVTNAQYGEFLNAKGQLNANGIYNSNMPIRGITQTGISGNFSYTVTTALANHPVVYVSWYDAARFANWMMNGQGSGDMETGAYTLNNASSGLILANAGASLHIPSEDEWYKAAYYNAVNTSYSLYPIGSNSVTNAEANFYPSQIITDVGTYSGFPSSYGTYDQGGNVFEWNDGYQLYSSTRVIRGGSWGNPMGNLASTVRYDYNWSSEDPILGFRLASTIPEPSSLLLTILTGGMLLVRRNRSLLF